MFCLGVQFLSLSKWEWKLNLFELGSSTLHASLAMRAEASLGFIQVEPAAHNVTLMVGKLQLMSNHHLEKAG